MPRNLAQPDHLLLRQVGHVHLAVERQHVVLAQAEELDVLHHHHLVVLHVVQRAVQDIFDVHLVAAGQKAQRLVDALRRAQQAIALRVLAQAAQHFLDQRERSTPSPFCGSIILTTALVDFIGSHFKDVPRGLADADLLQLRPFAWKHLFPIPLQPAADLAGQDSPTSAPYRPPPQRPRLPDSGCGGRTAAPLPAAPVRPIRR